MTGNLYLSANVGDGFTHIAQGIQEAGLQLGLARPELVSRREADHDLIANFLNGSQSLLNLSA